MTIDELWERTDARFTKLDDKLDATAAAVVRHEENLAHNNRECKEIKERMAQFESKADTRLTKLEQWKWFMLGAGVSSGTALGAGAVKLFCN